MSDQYEGLFQVKPLGAKWAVYAVSAIDEEDKILIDTSISTTKEEAEYFRDKLKRIVSGLPNRVN